MVGGDSFRLEGQQIKALGRTVLVQEIKDFSRVLGPDPEHCEG